jgi:hypothetical protein
VPQNGRYEADKEEIVNKNGKIREITKCRRFKGNLREFSRPKKITVMNYN